ncbi:MAG: hypothetical protein K2K74_04625 [Lachnospiraceae bacterium]|nr:hypothetical protein [Lachnospiraceae bacterium]
MEKKIYITEEEQAKCRKAIEKKDRMNEMDSPDVGIMEMCITACFMELWVTMVAGRGKAALCFSMCCEHSYP